MIRVSAEPFDPAVELKAFEEKTAGAGAIVSFLGKVRGENHDDPVVAISLEHYPGLTENSVSKITDEARRRWKIDDVLIIHRIGWLGPNEPIVLVCVSAAHRRDAFNAADFLMDYLKTKALFWKKESRRGGEKWIEPRREDYKDARRWSTDEEE